MELDDLQPYDGDFQDLKPVDRKITRSPPLPDKCVHCKSLLSMAGSRGIATWPVCIECFKTVYNDNLTTYLKRWIENEHKKMVQKSSV